MKGRVLTLPIALAMLAMLAIPALSAFGRDASSEPGAGAAAPSVVLEATDQADSRGQPGTPDGFNDFSYTSIAGAVLRPRASSGSWGYSGTGCLSAPSGAEFFNVPLDLPNGSRIDFVRMYFYDTSASDSFAALTSYNGAGGFADLGSVSSSGTAGFGTTLSAYIGHVVTTLDNSYVLNWLPNQNGNTMRLCRLRVAWRAPILDRIFFNDFEL